MEKHPNPFDEFLKETLKGHRLDPPEEAKKAFLREAGTIIQTHKGFTKWYYFPILVVLLTGIILVFYYGNNHEQNISQPIINEQIISNTDLTANQAPASDPVSTSNPEINPKTALTSTPNTSSYSTTGNEPSAGLTSTPDENAVKSDDKPEGAITAISEQGVTTQIDTLL